MRSGGKRLLLHACCAPCFCGAYEKIKNEYNVTAFFFNPCIYPDEELKKRLAELEKYAVAVKVPVITDLSGQDEFSEITNALGNEPEGGVRCVRCIGQRLKKTADFAIKNGFDFFSTALSISPYKNFETVKTIGSGLSRFLGIDFSDKFDQSITISKEHNLYRQKYCGCKFSLKKIQKHC